MFGMELDRYVETGEIPLAELLDAVFQNVLYLDISLTNGKYKEDLELFRKQYGVEGEIPKIY